MQQQQADAEVQREAYSRAQAQIKQMEGQLGEYQKIDIER